MADRPEISLVIPSYRSLRTIGFTIRSLLEQAGTVSKEILVVDSSGSDITAWIRTRFPTVRIIHLAERLYPGAARNLGAQEASGDFLGFLDADVVAEPNWLDTLSSRIRKHPDSIAGGFVGNANPHFEASRLQHWIEFSEFVPGTSSGPRDFLSSSNLFLSRSTFEAVGGFPEEWPMAEDLLLFRRNRGRAWFEGRTGVRHHHRTRWSGVLRHLNQLGYWSGRLRREEVMQGSALVRFPLLALFLPGYRTPVILSRLWRADRREGLAATLRTPLLLFALVRWSSGFRRGIQS